MCIVLKNYQDMSKCRCNACRLELCRLMNCAPSIIQSKYIITKLYINMITLRDKVVTVEDNGIDILYFSTALLVKITIIAIMMINYFLVIPVETSEEEREGKREHERELNAQGVYSLLEE